jgi:hypothetical protein
MTKLDPVNEKKGKGTGPDGNIDANLSQTQNKLKV